MSAKLIKLYNSLPAEAQQMFVETYLVGLIDLIPKEKSNKVVSAATRLQNQYKKAPKVDLRAKQRQISNLLDELNRDSKVAFVKERSNREELLSEIINSLVSWLNDIWSTVYEHNCNFLLAHTCLLFAADSLRQISDSPHLGGCRCSVMNMPVDFTLRNQNGKSMKQFSVFGPRNVDRILLWIWRDLLVMLLAKGSTRDKGKVSDYLEDIEDVLGVSALENLLYGGKPKENDDEDDDNYGDVENWDDEEPNSIGDQSCWSDDSDADGEFSICPCHFHANYWSENVNKQRLTLKTFVEERLFAIFQLAPSVVLNNTLLAISSYPDDTQNRIVRTLTTIAGDTPDNLVAALNIHIASGNQTEIASLLDDFSYLLRPRDSMTLQFAVAMLEDSHHHHRSLSILEKELNDCVRAIHAAVRTCFSHIEEDINKKEIDDIIKLKNGSPVRKERANQWVERVVTASNSPMHPMAFAAMMIGLPMMPGTEDADDDVYNYVDFDQGDPDIADLKDEFRPNLKGTLDGWLHLGQSIQGGSGVLAKLYSTSLELMPWLRGSDIVEEMIMKLSDRPNKVHVQEALIQLSSFAKMQRKITNLNRTDKTQNRKRQSSKPTARTSEQGSSASASRGPTISDSVSFSFTSSNPLTHPPTSELTNASTAGLPSSSFRPTIHGGMEDVD